MGFGELHLSTLPAIWSVARDGVNATWLERAMCVVISPYAIDTLYWLDTDPSYSDVASASRRVLSPVACGGREIPKRGSCPDTGEVEG